jgi:hypothetical protein
MEPFSSAMPPSRSGDEDAATHNPTHNPTHSSDLSRQRGLGCRAGTDADVDRRVGPRRLAVAVRQPACPKQNDDSDRRFSGNVQS